MVSVGSETPIRCGRCVAGWRAVWTRCVRASTSRCHANRERDAFLGCCDADRGFARLAVAAYVHPFSDPVRIHGSNGYRSPIEAEIRHARGEAIAA